MERITRNEEDLVSSEREEFTRERGRERERERGRERGGGGRERVRGDWGVVDNYSGNVIADGTGESIRGNMCYINCLH